MKYLIFLRSCLVEFEWSELLIHSRALVRVETAERGGSLLLKLVCNLC